MIIDAIARWASDTPDKTAIRYNGADLSYSEFLAAIAAARAFFLERGIAGEGVAAVTGKNQLHFWILSLALRSLGLTTATPLSLDDCGELQRHHLRCVATSSGGWQKLSAWCRDRAVPFLCCPVGGASSGAWSAGPEFPFGGNLLSTSGTTGRIKRVLIDPDHEQDYYLSRRDLLEIDADTMFLLFNLQAWTGSGYKTPMTVWAAGGGVIVDQRTQSYAPLMAGRITHAALVPSILSAVLEAPEGAFPVRENMQLSLTGGIFTERLIEQASRRLSPILYNRLSSTETSIFGFTRIERAEDRRWHRILAGRIVQVVDEADHLLPVGQTGRIRVATGDGPDRYFDNPTASREFFKDGFFYSGDLGCFREDGRLLLQGRNSDVMNLNGHKVAPEQIEDDLKKALDVADICVFSAADTNGDEELYVVTERQAPLDVARARDVLLRAFRVEPCFRRIDVLPRTETGKIVRSSVRQAILGQTG